MKKFVGILLLAALFCGLMAQAEDVLAPYALAAPAGVALEEAEGGCTYVSGSTRVVAITVPRVPDGDPAAALPRLMSQFDKEAVFGEDLALREGFHGMRAVNADGFAPGVDKVTLMILHEGDLLILCGYDMAGDGEARDALLDALLQAVTLDGQEVSLAPAK